MLQGRPRLPHLQNGGNRMDIEAGKTLTNEEVIRELLELLKKNAMKEQANDVFEICSYVDVLEKKIDSMTEELTNQIYRTRENRLYCKEHGIRLSGPKLGRPSATAKVDKKQEYQDNTDRIEVERTFRLSKRCYGMSCITTKLEETQLTSIALSVFVTNLFRIQRRILCALLHLFQFCHDWNRCKSWKLQISA